MHFIIIFSGFNVVYNVPLSLTGRCGKCWSLLHCGSVVNNRKDS